MTFLLPLLSSLFKLPAGCARDLTNKAIKNFEMGKESRECRVSVTEQIKLRILSFEKRISSILKRILISFRQIKIVDGLMEILTSETGLS